MKLPIYHYIFANPVAYIYIVNFCLYHNKVPYCILILFIQFVYSGKVIYLIIILLTAKWPDRLAEAKNDPLREMQLVQDCSANNEDVMLLRKEVIERSTCNSSIKNVFICFLSV